MDAPAEPPGGPDRAGPPRWRWQYTLWYAWRDDPPSMQDWKDFVFTTWLSAGVAALVALPLAHAYLLGQGAGPGAIAILYMVSVAASVVAMGLYVARGRRDWDRKRA